MNTLPDYALDAIARDLAPLLAAEQQRRQVREGLAFAAVLGVVWIVLELHAAKANARRFRREWLSALEDVDELREAREARDLAEGRDTFDRDAPTPIVYGEQLAAEAAR